MVAFLAPTGARADHDWGLEGPVPDWGHNPHSQHSYFLPRVRRFRAFLRPYREGYYSDEIARTPPSYFVIRSRCPYIAPADLYPSMAAR
jgi:hypothetical protein